MGRNVKIKQDKKGNLGFLMRKFGFFLLLSVVFIGERKGL